MKCARCGESASAKARFCPSCGQPMAEPRTSTWEEIRQRFNRGDYTGAESLLQPLFKDTGSDGAKARVWAGHAHFLRGKEGLAQALYLEALEMDSRIWDAHFQLGSLAFTQGKHAEAVQHFSAAAACKVSLEAHPLGGLFGGEVARARAQMHLYMGLSLREQHQLAEAETALRNSLSLSPGEPLAYGILGDLLMGEGRFEDAAECYRGALGKVKDEQGLRSLRNDLGVAFFRGGQTEKAAEAFKKVLQDKPDDEHALHNLGMLYLKQGLGEELKQDLKEFMRGDKAEQILLGLTRSLVEGARQQAAQGPTDTGIIGRSRSIRDVLDLVARAAANDANVLLLGENGTGKELVARAVHTMGPRSRGPFVAVNCAALPETLLESELFGHERGAFTGAVSAKPGRFELAAGGTLFLDEIGDLAPSLQVKLLRAVQEKSFERVGGTRTLHSDFRLVAATHRDLRRMVLDGRFREDLFYRLFVIPIQLPPLRERIEDIPLLAAHFLRSSSGRLGKSFTRMDPKALERLSTHPWPGNVRELENCIERAVAMHEGPELMAGDLSLEHFSQPSSPEPSAETWSPVERAERDAIARELREARHRVPLAAQRLGLSRATLYRKISKYGLKNINIEINSRY